jgi:hypothetical protein
MSDYSKVTAFTPKDSLASGDPDKLVVGSELDGEFDAIAAMSATKEDKINKGASLGYAPLDSDARVPVLNQHATTDYTDVGAAHTVGKSTGISALTDGATITIDCTLSNVFSVTLGGNRTFAAPTSPYDGQVINVILVQDATGSRTITWNAAFPWPAATPPTLTTTGNAVDMITMQYHTAAAKWRCASLLNFT